jgi:hypothetical protein
LWLTTPWLFFLWWRISVFRLAYASKITLLHAWVFAVTYSMFQIQFRLIITGGKNVILHLPVIVRLFYFLLVNW